MTEYQKLQLRLSEIRQRLNEIQGTDGDLSDDVRGEVDRLTTEYRDKETRARAALVSEQAAEDSTETETTGGDGEGAELARMRREVRFARYVAAAAGGRAPDGVERELAQAVGVESRAGGVVVPWAAVDPAAVAERATVDAGGDRETRADALTDRGALDGGVSLQRILPRLFGGSVFDALGVRLDEVPAGRAEWPVISTGVAPGQVKEGANTDATALTFATAVLKPKRLQGAYSWSVEIAAEVPEVEEAARRDLVATVRASMYATIVNGAVPTPSAPQNVQGFLSKIAAPDPAPAAETGYADYAAALAAGVDGVHAEAEGEVAAVLGVATYQHAGAAFHVGSGEAGIEAMRRRGRLVQASSFIPAADGADVQAALLHGGAEAARGDTVAAVWPGVELIRDPYTNAGAGVRLTWLVLWDASVAFRAAAYKRVAFKLA